MKNEEKKEHPAWNEDLNRWEWFVPIMEELVDMIKELFGDPTIKFRDEEEIYDFMISYFTVSYEAIHMPKSLSAKYYVMSELLKRSKNTDDIEERKICNIIIGKISEELNENNMCCWRVRDMNDEEKEYLDEVIENLFSMDPEEMYRLYIEKVQSVIIPFIEKMIDRTNDDDILLMLWKLRWYWKNKIH